MRSKVKKKDTPSVELNFTKSINEQDQKYHSPIHDLRHTLDHVYKSKNL